MKSAPPVWSEGALPLRDAYYGVRQTLIYELSQRRWPLPPLLPPLLLPPPERCC